MKRKQKGKGFREYQCHIYRHITVKDKNNKIIAKPHSY